MDQVIYDDEGTEMHSFIIKIVKSLVSPHISNYKSYFIRNIYMISKSCSLINENVLPLPDHCIDFRCWIPCDDVCNKWMQSCFECFEALFEVCYSGVYLVTISDPYIINDHTTLKSLFPGLNFTTTDTEIKFASYDVYNWIQRFN